MGSQRKNSAGLDNQYHRAAHKSMGFSGGDLPVNAGASPPDGGVETP